MSSFHFGCDGSLHCSLYCPHTAHLHDVHAMSKQSTKCGSRDFDIIFFNVRGSDTTLKSVCTLGIRTLDSMRRCTRNVVLPTSLKTFTTLFFQKCFFCLRNDSQKHSCCRLSQILHKKVSMGRLWHIFFNVCICNQISFCNTRSTYKTCNLDCYNYHCSFFLLIFIVQ